MSTETPDDPSHRRLVSDDIDMADCPSDECASDDSLIFADSAPPVVSITPLSPETPDDPETAEELERSDESESDDSVFYDSLIFAAPKVSITLLSPPETPDDPSQCILVAQTPEELQRSFQQKFNDYNKARNDSASQPSIIADCEDKLHQIISKFIFYKGSFPHLYPGIIKLPAIQSMLQLLKDDNYCGYGLASCILLAFKVLTYEDVLVKGQIKYVDTFVESLVEFGALDVFVSVLGKFPEYDKNVFRALQTIAQMMFQEPSVADSAGKETKLIEWVLKALRAPRWGKPKEYAVGFLETLLMSSVENRFQLGKMGTVAVVVNALSSLKCPNREVEDSTDFENAEADALDALSRCLFLLLEDGDNKEKFANAGGVRLMIEFIQSKKFGCYYYGTAIAALCIAVKDCPSASEKFVNDDSGLDIVFPDSMDKIPPSIMHEKEEIEEHLTSLISLLTGGIAKTKKDLLLEKFEENDYENITWLTKLLLQYSKKAEATKNHLKDKPLDLSEYYREKLRNELSTLQSIAVILGYLWSSKNSVIRARIEKELSHRKLEKKHVRDILSTYRDNIGDASESSTTKKAVITEYIDSLEENPDHGDGQDVKIKRLRWRD